MKLLTPFGKAMRKYRVDLGETQMEVARAISVSVAFLSAIETGKKNVPDKVFSRIVTHFGLSTAEIDSMKHLAWISQKEVKINMQKLDNRGRELVAGFARRFEEQQIDEEQLRRLREIFEMEGK
ncbi:MAG: helix-turn-helix domain-containing protein [Candidatus Thiodiazotropha sp. (ex Codakia rugifera)]|nr:helix-turn-helix domain-containing protein [Candidatus Thiodiazotropha sp. (ex Codakia rugifera)]